ncbi:xanthine dehydrogenase family protein molybdopterin-binding subunit [Zhaonella formicivorans]|uniref:xanthine dehydrogenase family protein molybdopterin-binding subunit n=1 Tax=Zhaonella formicivorans TaxID=2528593 RepID=UPI0010DC6CE3|nr:molybdopterin cofactor-binding domain-containing protein [Zhaonella formicivorans]
MSVFRNIGQSVPRIDGWEKVTGTFKFPSDLKVPGMLYGKVLRSPFPHARIIKVDTNAAKAIEGVVAVITAEDVPAAKIGEAIADMNILAVEKVRYIGDPVAAVAAVDEETALKALAAIKVEYKELPAVFDPEEAMQPGQPLIHEGKENNVAVFNHVVQGDVEAAFAKADVVVEDTFELPFVHQSYLEPNTCLASFEPGGRLNIWSPNQGPAWLRARIASLFGLKLSEVRVVQVQGGGAFGAKLPLTIEPICVALARKAGRPVFLANTREEEYEATWPRVPMKIRMALAASQDGTLLAKRSTIIADNGAYSNIAPGVLSTAVTRIDNLYRIKNVDNIGYLVYTNKLPTGMFRGFGNPQTTFAIEVLMDQLAVKLGMDPAELRIKNATRTGDVTVHGWEITSSGLTDCIREVVRRSGWDEKRKNKVPGRGIGLACCIHVSGNRGVYPSFDGSAAEVRISADGMVTVFSGEGEIGCGTTTVWAQIAAEALGIGVDRVRVAEVDSDYSPFGLGAYASRVTVIGGNAVLAAARDARRQLLEAAGEILGLAPDKLDIRDGKIISLVDNAVFKDFAEIATEACYRRGGTVIVGRGSYVPSNVTIADPKTKYGNIAPSYSFGCQLAEVEVDQETGKVKVLKIIAVQDLGRVLNPTLAEGQLEGGVAMGIGYTFMEEIITKEGRILNPNFRDYKLPVATDMPPIEVAFVETLDPIGPFGAKSVAEPALVPTAPAIINAIRDAVGVYVTSLPVKPEKLLAALEKRLEQE